MYNWKTKYYKTDPNIAGAVCKELEENGGLTPKALVDASRPEEAPLHKEFEWRDSIAAEKYREHQARGIICNLVIKTEQIEPVRAFVSIETTERVYESIDVVLKDENKTEQMFRQAMGELNTFKKKYFNLKEFARLFAEIDRLEKGENE